MTYYMIEEYINIHEGVIREFYIHSPGKRKCIYR